MIWCPGRLFRPAELILFVILWGCRGTPSEKADGVPEGGALAPQLSIEPTGHDFGVVTQGDVLRRTFSLRNAGTSRLEIQTAGPVLGCTGQPDLAVLETGGESQFRVTCTTELHGPLRVSLPVRSNGGSKELALVARVTPLLSFEPPLLDMMLAYDEERSAEVRLTGALARAARLEIKDRGTCGFDVRALDAAAEHGNGIHVALKKPRVGTHVGNLSFTTGLERPAEILLPYSCRVTGTLSVSPTNPYFNLRLSGPKSIVLEVKSAQPSFAIRSVEVLDGPFEAAFERAGAEGAYRVTVRVLEERLTETRGTVGTLRIRSTDRSELVKDVPLLALGRLNPTN